MRKIYQVLLLIVLIGSANSAHAGFPIGKYRGLIIPSFNYYTSKDIWDANGNKVVGAPGTGFTSYSFGLYAGYGLTRRLDVIVNMTAPLQVSKYRNGNDSLITQHSAGLGDLQAGLSYNLINFNYTSFFSVMGSAIIPLYSNSGKQVYLGYGVPGAELKFMYTGSIDPYGHGAFKGWYYNFELGYRRYFDIQGPNVIIYTGSVGVPVGKHSQVSVEVSGQDASSINKSFNANLAINRDYAFTKVALNYGHSFTRTFYVFLTGFDTVTGRNTGIGYGGSVQTIFKF